MTLKDLIDFVILDLDEDTTNTTLRDKIKKFINRGYKELAKKEGLSKRKILYPYEGKVNKPADLVKLFDVLLNDVHISYQFNGSVIRVDVGDNEIEAIYTYIPEDMSADTDEPETNIANDEFIIQYAKWLYHMAEQNVSEANIMRNELGMFNIEEQNINYNFEPIYHM